MIRHIAPIGGAAGVEHQDAVAAVTNWLVTVAIHQHIKVNPGKLFQQALFQVVRCSPTMDQANPCLTNFNHSLLREARDIWIHIAAHSQNRALGKCVQDLRCNHISGVQDHLYTSKGSRIQIGQKRQGLG